MKKHILPLLTAVGISAVGAAGLYCVAVFLSCFMDGDPKAHPVAFPVSVLAGLACLALFVLLLCCYVRQRRKAPSVLWMLVDVAAGLLLLAAVLLFSGCAQEPEDPYRVQIRVLDDKVSPPSAPDAQVELYRMEPFYYEIDHKTVSGANGGQLVTALTALELTEERVPAIAKVDSANAVWAEFDGSCYRLLEGKLALVQERFGEGQVLANSEEASRLLSYHWLYYPRDVYDGVCKDGLLELEHVFAGESDLTVELEGFSVNHDADTHFGSAGSAKLRLRSRTDQTVKLSLCAYASSDNYGALESEVVELKAGKEKTVTLDFRGWNTFDYWVDMEVENVLIRIRVCRPEAS